MSFSEKKFVLIILGFYQQKKTPNLWRKHLAKLVIEAIWLSRGIIRGKKFF